VQTRIHRKNDWREAKILAVISRVYIKNRLLLIFIGISEFVIHMEKDVEIMVI